MFKKISQIILTITILFAHGLTNAQYREYKIKEDGTRITERTTDPKAYECERSKERLRWLKTLSPTNEQPMHWLKNDLKDTKYRVEYYCSDTARESEIRRLTKPSQ